MRGQRTRVDWIRSGWVRSRLRVVWVGQVWKWVGSRLGWITVGLGVTGIGRVWDQEESGIQLDLELSWTAVWKGVRSQDCDMSPISITILTMA
jgi:hypothetical protein